MTDNIDDIVSVQISRETTPVQQDSFGIVMILGTHKNFNSRLKYYSSLTEMVADGFISSTKEYIAASKVFGQTPRVTTVAVGRRSVDDASVVVGTVANSTAYTITINGIACTYTSAGSGDNATTIGEGLESAINTASAANSWGLTATNTTGTIAIVAAVDNTAWTLAVGQRLTISTLVASADIEDDLSFIEAENGNWYGLVITSRTSQDVQDVAAWVEANKKIFGTASSNAHILDDAQTDDIAYILKQANYSRTFVLYHQDAATTYPEAAWFGRRFPYAPGSGTWAYKSLAGISVSVLTTDQRANAHAKNANTFESRGGASVTADGVMSSGEYIDVMRGLDWLESKIQEYIFSRLVNLPKIPYTDTGVAIIEAELRRALDLAIAQGVLADEPAYIVTVPLVANVSANDKATRNLPDVNFTATLAGAIHHVTVVGSVSV